MAENTSGSDLFDFSGPEDELASAPLPPPEESDPSTSLLDEVYARDTDDEYCSDGDSRNKKKSRSTLQQLPSKPNTSQTPTRPRASRKRYTVVESSSSSGDELNDDNSERSSKKPRKEDSIKSMLKLLCEKVEKNERTLRELQNVHRCMPNIIHAYMYVRGVLLFRSTLYFWRCFVCNITTLLINRESSMSSSSESTPKRRVIHVSPRVRVSCL